MSNFLNLLAYLLALAVGLGVAWGGWSYYQSTQELPLTQVEVIQPLIDLGDLLLHSQVEASQGLPTQGANLVIRFDEFSNPCHAPAR